MGRGGVGDRVQSTRWTLAQVDAPPETRAGSQHVFGVLTGGQVCGTRLAQDLQACLDALPGREAWLTFQPGQHGVRVCGAGADGGASRLGLDRGRG